MEDYRPPSQEDSFAIRRRVPRRKFTDKVGLLVHGTYKLERAHEIGEGGMMVESEFDLEKGQMVVVSLIITGLVQTTVRGEIRYCVKPGDGTPNRYGIEFKNLDFRAKRNIRSYVASSEHIRIGEEAQKKAA